MGQTEAWIGNAVVPNLLLWVLGLAVAGIRQYLVTRWRGEDGAPVEVSTVILTALDVEYMAVRDRLHIVSELVHPRGTRFEIGRLDVGGARIALALTGSGNQDTAVLTERAIGFLKPRSVVFVGVAGALHTDLRLGDLVVATKVHAYQCGRLEGKVFNAAPTTWRPAHALLERARKLARTDPWRGRVHFRPVAAGDVVVNSLDDPGVDVLRHHYSDAAAVEMESAGLAAAVTLNDFLPALVVRGVSDHANGEKDLTDCLGWQEQAAASAAAFVTALGLQLPDVPQRTG